MIIDQGEDGGEMSPCPAWGRNQGHNLVRIIKALTNVA